jgi:hypothetical protein
VSAAAVSVRDICRVVADRHWTSAPARRTVTAAPGTPEISILKYNITLNPEDIHLFLRTDNFDYYNDIFFKSLKNIDTIVFDNTIIAFQDLNTLFILFYEKDKNNIMTTNMNNTRKIYLRSHDNTKHKKTIRK